ncbi:hypothetical protein HYC85_011200 [Camellia sinensis]|uniref:Aminotransferase class I/classII large domain-containing protein n=1 Tax=Camellia sinensis TaxID=4442 RepID=A0A7J7HMS5_CAMSI|nr:hypothetical protein HYC85_011200 [Camellia sinensis]
MVINNEAELLGKQQEIKSGGTVAYQKEGSRNENCRSQPGAIYSAGALQLAVAKFTGRVRGGRVKFDPNRIVMSGGVNGANETIMFCLADPGDAFLVPSPYYSAYVLIFYTNKSHK